MRKWFWPFWIMGNLSWLLGMPMLYAFWLWNEVQREYAAGIRIATDGDSISIPVAGFTITNTAFLVAINISWGVYALIKRRRSP